MTTNTKSSEQPSKPPAPPVLIFGPPGSGKTLLIDLMVRFYGSTHVEDGYTLPPHGPGGELGGENCRWMHLKPGTLYITNENFSKEESIHAAMGHGVCVSSIYETMEDMGRAKGRTAEQYYTQRAMEELLKRALRGKSL